MLTSDEKDRIRATVQALASAGDVSFERLIALMAALPARAEALEMARELLAAQAPLFVPELDRVVSQLRELLSAPTELPAAPRSSLEVLLATPGPREPRVDALIAVTRATDRTATPVIRARIPVETDPFVLATLASALGQLGDKSDAAALLPLLDSTDARVVANALDALNRMEAEAPVEQVRELVHAADHRLRLSALSLFARTDPVNALLALPPLIGENHPTLTGGIALLLGDLAAQPLATDQLLELVESEDRPQILRHIADSLKRHAEAAPERVPEITQRLMTTRQAARLHKVPILTGLLEALGAKNLAPVFSETTNLAAKAPVEEAEPAPPAAVTASRVQPRPPGLTAASRSGAIPRPADLGSGTAHRSGALARPADLARPDDEPAVKPWMWIAGAACALAFVAVLASGGTSKPSSSASRAASEPLASNTAKPRPDLSRASVAIVPPPAGTKSLGPAGAELKVEGTVVSVANHRVVVRVGDTFYSCRGKSLVDMRVGEPVKLKGRLAGVARDGMVLMTVDRS